MPELLDIVPRNGRHIYDMRKVIDVVFDAGSCFEVQPDFGRPVICALCRLGGHPVAVIANQPQVLAGSIDADGADKAAHFITVADSFHLPLVFLSDNPGVLPGQHSEQQAILRKGARMYAAQTLATTPKFEVTLRKAYGFGSMVMGMIPFDGQSGVFAFPGATMGAMGAAAMSRRAAPTRTKPRSCGRWSCRRPSAPRRASASTSSSIRARSATSCCTRSSARCTAAKPRRNPSPASGSCRRCPGREEANRGRPNGRAGHPRPAPAGAGITTHRGAGLLVRR